MAVLYDLEISLKQSNRTWLELSEQEKLDIQQVKDGVTPAAKNAELILGLYGESVNPYPIKKFTPQYLASLSENTETFNYELQLAPNPANIQTQVSFVLPKWARTTSLKVTDQYYQMGTELITLNIEPGSSTVILPTHNINTGIYIVNLVVNGKIVDGEQLLVIH